MTNRISWTSPSAPTTEFVLEADRLNQDAAGNFTRVRVYGKSINRGSTSSFSNYAGQQTCSIDGISTPKVNHIDTPFLPIGVGPNVQRWRDGPVDIQVPHGADGTRGPVTLRMYLAYGPGGGTGGSFVATFNDFPRISKPASAPGTPVASELMPQSVRISWTASSDNGGSPIDYYRLRRTETTDGSGPYVDSDANDISRVISGLTPGKLYTFRVYAHNGSNGEYSPASGILTVTMLAPVRIKIGGVWKFAIPFVRVAGVWKMAEPFIKVAGSWKRTG